MRSFQARVGVIGGLLVGSIAANAGLVGSYGFQGTLASDIGGPSLVGLDPLSQNNYTTTTLYGKTRQVYNMFGSGGAGNNAGLTLDASGMLTNNSDYSVEMLFTMSGNSGWRKVYDNSNRAQDQGLYVAPNDTFDYYPESGGTAGFSPNTFYNVILTHNATTNLTDIYVNGVLDSSVTATEANIADRTTPLSFFMDDSATGFNEYSNASVGLIRVWNNELSASDVTSIESNPFSPAPEPASMLALGAGAVAILARRRR